jgi:hypothetical protein
LFAYQARAAVYPIVAAFRCLLGRELMPLVAGHALRRCGRCQLPAIRSINGSHRPVCMFLEDNVDVVGSER